jgi:hypothetical protein
MKIKIIRTLAFYALLALSTGAQAASNYHCVFSDSGRNYTIDIYSAPGLWKPVLLVIMDEAKHVQTFSASELQLPPAPGFDLIAKNGDANLSIGFLWGNDPNALTFQAQVMGSVPAVGFPAPPSLSNLQISQMFVCRYF